MKKFFLAVMETVTCALMLLGCNALNTNSQIVVKTDDFESTPEESVPALNTSGSAKRTGSKQASVSSKAGKKTGSKAGTAARPKTYTPKKVAQNLLFSGRAALVGSGASLDWDCAAVTFRAQCSGALSVTLSAQGAGIAYLRAFVDEKEISAGRIAVTAENTLQITLAEQLKSGTHTVQLLRISGNDPPYITLTGITLSGSFLPPPTQTEDRILFVGGTLFTGEAALLSDDEALAVGDDGTPLRRVENRDSSKTFAYLTAKQLGLSYEIITRANTGFGISDYDNDTVSLTGLFNLSSRREGSKSYQVPGRVKYVVIGGVNADFNLFLHKAKGQSAAESFQKQQDFIQSMLLRYPGCKVIWCYGQREISSYNLSCIQKSIALRGGEPNGVYLLKLSACKRLERPGAETHRELAKELCSFIQKISQ